MDHMGGWGVMQQLSSKVDSLKIQSNYNYGTPGCTVFLEIRISVGHKHKTICS